MDDNIDVEAIRAKYRGRIQNDPHGRGALFSRLMVDNVLHDYRIIDKTEADPDCDLSRRVSTHQIAKDCLSLHGLSLEGTRSDNNAMADAVTLFHSSHANVGTGGVPSATTLDAFRNLMSSQTGPSGETLNIRLALLIGPPELESTMVALRDQAALPDPLTPGYQAGHVSVVTDSRLSGTAFYGCADPRLHSGIELVTLEGASRPLLERQTVFVSDAIEWKVLHDAVALPVDYRTLVYNAGA